MTAVQALESLRDLKPNWNGEGALPICPDCIEQARRFLYIIPHAQVVPTAHGGVQLEWYEGDVDCELLFESPRWWSDNS